MSRSVFVVVLIGLALLMFRPTLAAAEGWRWPVRGEVLERFEYGSDPFAAGQHRGVDIAAPLGTPVRSACSGQVRFAGRAGDAGRVVSVVCGGLTATYLHLDSIAVRRGEAVGAGDWLGRVGRSGRPRRADPHLHLGARRIGERFGYVDPLALLVETSGVPGVPGAPVVPVARPGRPQPIPALRGPAGLGPAPAPAPVAAPSPRRRPSGVRATPAPVGAQLPWTVWAGVALLALALPLPALRHRGARRRAAPSSPRAQVRRSLA